MLYEVITGPNSKRWNGGMKGIKGSTDEGGVRSPCFIKWDGTIPKGRKIKEISCAIDILPTLLELAGVNVALKKSLDGVSLSPLLLNEKMDWPERLIFNHSYNFV